MRKIYLLVALTALLVSCGQNKGEVIENIQTASFLPDSSTSAVVSNTSNAQGDVWLESLITKSPQEGRALAIKMARKTIGAIQSDPEVKKRLRKEYAEDSEQLILSAQVVAIEFRTVAEANNYWRK